MPWNKGDYPDSFKNLEPIVRNKAIEIANALLREGTDEGRAISIATAKAREYVHGEETNRTAYVVRPRDEDWVLMKKDGDRAIFKEETKSALLDKAKPYVNEHDGTLTVYHEDGSLEKTLYE
ncbi:hypothetical protein QWT69_15035 [Sporosarcina oncorhynchi]|uniref:DUF2188 domain-containing protein n=1 Tax=Sporosarcina oncorhynchi TaxID=3056444 RepID=A0ABZ0L3U9_9BACL|nr:hypothetical protein [Sporosarcina sp. T2O-4]WOV87158.1 hypothetical protein QWT69_15035 [Sporosarcina sp. T2O-4]